MVMRLNSVLIRFRDDMGFDEIFVEGNAEAGAIGDGDPAIFGLHFFVGEFVADGFVFDAIFEKEGIAARC